MRARNAMPVICASKGSGLSAVAAGALPLARYAHTASGTKITPTKIPKINFPMPKPPGEFFQQFYFALRLQWDCRASITRGARAGDAVSYKCATNVGARRSDGGHSEGCLRVRQSEQGRQANS